MKRIGILSDTHGYFNPALKVFFRDCDELWHAGDWGDMTTVEQVRAFKPVRGVYGNIDDAKIRLEFPEVLVFDAEGLKVCMMHIGGYPGRYSARCMEVIGSEKPDMMVCGHSHILKVMRDKTRSLMHFNPGAAGNKGFHNVCTALRFAIQDKKPQALEIWEQKRV